MEKAGGAAKITMSRPVKHNAMDMHSFREFGTPVRELNRDAAVRAIIITVAGILRASITQDRVIQRTGVDLPLTATHRLPPCPEVSDITGGFREAITALIGKRPPVSGRRCLKTQRPQD